MEDNNIKGYITLQVCYHNMKDENIVDFIKESIYNHPNVDAIIWGEIKKKK